jgi:hypothetical protein
MRLFLQLVRKRFKMAPYAHMGEKVAYCTCHIFETSSVNPTFFLFLLWAYHKLRPWQKVSTNSRFQNSYWWITFIPFSPGCSLWNNLQQVCWAQQPCSKLSTRRWQLVNKAVNKQCEHILLISCWNSIATSLLKVVTIRRWQLVNKLGTSSANTSYW